MSFESKSEQGHRQMFGIREIGFPPDDHEVLARQAAITAAIQPIGLKWLTFAIGRFLDGGPAIRFAFEANSDTESKQFKSRLQSTLRSAASALTFEALNDWEWFNAIYVRQGSERKLGSTQVEVPVPLPDITASGHSLWVASLLDGISSLSISKTLGVAFFMRPAVDDPEVWRKLRLLDKESKHIATINALNDAYRTGAWWVDIRCFAVEHRERVELEAMLVSHISQMGKDFSTQPAGRAPLLSEHRNSTHPSLLTNPPTTDVDTLLERGGLDLVTYGRQIKDTGLPALKSKIKAPYIHDHFITGRNLWSLLQLPAYLNPLVRVERGFGYCVVPAQSGELTLGTHTPSSIETESGLQVRLDPDELTKHMLVVGATGSGKTTTVRSILAQLKEALGGRAERVNITVLEGAKREYHQGGSVWGMDRRYSLQGSDFLELNIFEHPCNVEPEAHLSMVASIFESALDMPTPLPALMREALMMAYSDYHNALPQVRAWNPHPIRYWLAKACERVLEKAGYGGENGQNIAAAMRTRLRDLSMGAGGRVLAGCQPWEELKRSLTGQNSVIEMESIPDAHNRSLVMSLFVLYYRYALRPSKQLRNILVVEEAHRIIGKSAHKDDSHEAFSQMLAEVRQLGCGVIISDQSPSRLIDDAMRNTNTKVLMRLVSGDDIGCAIRGAGLPAAAAEDIPNLRQGQAILVTPMSRPTIVKIKHVPAPEDNEETLSRASNAIEFAREFEAVSTFSAMLAGLNSTTSLKGMVPQDLVHESGERVDELLVQTAKGDVGCTRTERIFTSCPTHHKLTVLRVLLLCEDWIRSGKVHRTSLTD